MNELEAAVTRLFTGTPPPPKSRKAKRPKVVRKAKSAVRKIKKATRKTVKKARKAARKAA